MSVSFRIRKEEREDEKKERKVNNPYIVTSELDKEVKKEKNDMTETIVYDPFTQTWKIVTRSEKFLYTSTF